MKNLIIAALLALTTATSAFADPSKISSIVLDRFKVDFKNATEVSWSRRVDYTKAAFTLNEQKMEAFYDFRGEIIAISKNIKIDELPTDAKRKFARRFDNYTVKEVIKFEGVDETAYYISAEDEKEDLIIKVDESQQVTVFKRTKKNV